MAKIHEELVIIKLSKLVKDTASDADILANDDIVSSLESVAQELVGSDVIVEIIKNDN